MDGRNDTIFVKVSYCIEKEKIYENWTSFSCVWGCVRLICSLSGRFYPEFAYRRRWKKWRDSGIEWFTMNYIAWRHIVKSCWGAGGVRGGASKQMFEFQNKSRTMVTFEQSARFLIIIGNNWALITGGGGGGCRFWWLLF